MIKAKKYDWKDSNMALFGSDTDKKVYFYIYQNLYILLNKDLKSCYNDYSVVMVDYQFLYDMNEKKKSNEMF